MKIAGRKNDGAWYRTNKVIKTLSVEEATDLATKIEDLPSMPNFLEAVQAIAGQAGISTTHPSYPASTGTLAQTYSTAGVPRQVWFGNWSYDTYEKTGTAPDFVYTKTHWEIAQSFGEEIRKAMKEFLFARRALKDIANVEDRDAGNPGGIANATEGD